VSAYPRSVHIAIAFVAALCCLSASVAAQESPETVFGSAKEQYKEALHLTRYNQKVAAFRRCVEGFQKVLGIDSGGSVADKCYYLIGQCYQRITDINHSPEDLKSAIANYRIVVERYPSSSLADDAQYLIGVLYMADDPAQAYLEFVKVRLFCPKGDMRSKAERKIAHLRKVLNYSKNEENPPKDQDKSGTQAGGKNGKPPENHKRPASRHLARLDSIQRWSGEDYTRVVLYTSEAVNYKVNAIASDPGNRRPARIYLNLSNCVINPKMPAEIRLKDELVQEVRAEQCDATQARVLLEANGIGSYRVFSMADPSRLIVDVRGVEQPRHAAAPSSPPSIPPSAPSIVPPKGGGQSLPSLAQQLGLDIKRIVLDPGHGGKDKGAISPNGLYEKDITLELAQKLKKRLEEETGCEVMLTRTKDVYLSLEERTAIANTKKADLFVSIHTNANEDRSYHGTETYFLNLSKDKESARVAAFENATSTKRISDLEAILHNLMLNTKIDESARLAKDVQLQLVGSLKGKYNNVRDLGTKQAPFYVLLGAEMPSILVETAFITNQREEKRLKDNAFQDVLVEGMAKGIQSYIQHMKRFASAGGAR
jgi:N-acetylmuramoyl-L-alanine amidase